jgi:hypothetical protein
VNIEVTKTERTFYLTLSENEMRFIKDALYVYDGLPREYGLEGHPHYDLNEALNGA